MRQRPLNLKDAFLQLKGPDVSTMQKVNSGDPLVIPSGTYNAFVDAADFRARQQSQSANTPPRSAALGNRPAIEARSARGRYRRIETAGAKKCRAPAPGVRLRQENGFRSPSGCRACWHPHPGRRCARPGLSCLSPSGFTAPFASQTTQHRQATALRAQTAPRGERVRMPPAVCAAGSEAV